MVDDYNSFLEVLKAEFNDIDLKDWMIIESWSSMQKLLIMTAINDNYNIIVNHDDFVNADSIEAFYKLIFFKKK